MSRAADQRVVYALKNGRLVPKSEVLGKVAGASAPATDPVVEPVTEFESADDVQDEQEAAEPRRRGRPPKVRDEPGDDAFEIKE